MKTLLAFFSAPHQSSFIAQAMAIQAHQPDVIIQIEAEIDGQAKLDGQAQHLEMWLQGGEALLSLYSDLNQPFPFPYTPPKGFVPNHEAQSPKAFKKKTAGMDILQVLDNIKRDFPDYEYRFDLLPGAKMLKLDLLLHQDTQWRQTYTLENGEYLEFNKSGMSINDGQILSIVERSWLAGFPIHVSMNKEEILSKQDMFSIALESCYIEKFGAEELERTENVKKNFSKSDMRDLKKDRPISFRSDVFVRRFEERGGKVSNRSSKGMELIGPDGDIWKIDFFQNTIPNGVPFESLMVNELSKSWNCDEVLQGVSIIHPSSELREESFRLHFKRQLNQYTKHPDLVHETGPFTKRCEALGLSLDTPIENLISSDLQRLNETHDEESLIHIRVCEIDALTLDSNGICSFDGKQIMRHFYDKQAVMQRPAFLFNKNDSHFFVIGSTSHDTSSHEQRVVHISNLHKGRDVLHHENRHKWTPSQEDLEALKLDWNNVVDGILKKELRKSMDLERTFAENLGDYFSERIGISWENLSELLFSCQVNPVEAILHLEHPSAIELKNELITLSINFHETLVADLRHQIEMKKSKLRRFQKKNMNKQNSVPRKTNHDLNNRMFEILDTETSYTAFLSLLKQEGFKTKGMKKKITLMAEKNGWKFDMNGDIMIRSEEE